jgi:hypothetical protein
VRSLRFLLASIVVVAVAVGLPSAPAHAAAHHLDYHQGSVVSNVRLVALRWDDAWSYSGTPGQTIAQTGTHSMTSFLSGVVQSPYIDALSDYNTPRQTIGRGSFAGWSSLKPAPRNDGYHLHFWDVGGVLKNHITAGKVPQPDANTVYIVFMNSSHYYGESGFCAEHSSVTFNNKVVPFIVMSYLNNRPGCHTENGNVIDDMTYFIGHELAETITDPGFFGWYEGNVQGEVADVCPEAGFKLQLSDGLAYNVAPVWSNRENRCRAVPLATCNTATTTFVLWPGQCLRLGDSLTTTNGVSAQLTADGDLRVTKNGAYLWHGCTQGRGAYYLTMQQDGNLVLYGTAGIPIWASNTHDSYSLALLQNDGNFLVARLYAAPQWQSAGRPSCV